MASNEPPQTWNQFQKANKGKWSSAEMSAQWKLYKELQAGKSNNDIPADMQLKQAAASKPTSNRHSSNSSIAIATSKDGQPAGKPGTLHSFWDKPATSSTSNQISQSENSKVDDTRPKLAANHAEPRNTCKDKDLKPKLAAISKTRASKSQLPIQAFFSKPVEASGQQDEKCVVTESAGTIVGCELASNNNNSSTATGQSAGMSDTKQVVKQLDQQCSSIQQSSLNTINYVPAGMANRQTTKQEPATSANATVDYNSTEVLPHPSPIQINSQTDAHVAAPNTQADTTAAQSVPTNIPSLASFFKKTPAAQTPNSIQAVTAATSSPADASGQLSVPATTGRKLPVALLPPKPKPSQSNVEATSSLSLSKDAQHLSTDSEQHNKAVARPNKMNVILLPPTNHLTWNQFQSKARGMNWGKQRISSEWDLYKKTKIWPFPAESVHIAGQEVEDAISDVSSQYEGAAADDNEGYGESNGGHMKPSTTNPHAPADDPHLPATYPSLAAPASQAEQNATHTTASHTLQSGVQIDGTHVKASQAVHHDEVTSAGDSEALSAYKDQVAVAAAAAAHAAIAAAHHAEALAKVAEDALQSRASQRANEGAQSSHMLQPSSGQVATGQPPHDTATTKKKGTLRRLVGRVRKALGMVDGSSTSTQTATTQMPQAPSMSDTASSRAFPSAAAGALAAAAVVVSTASHPISDAELQDTASSSQMYAKTGQHAHTANANQPCNDRTFPVFPAPPLTSVHDNSGSHITAQLEVSTKPPPHIPGCQPVSSGHTLQDTAAIETKKNAESQAQKLSNGTKIVDITADTVAETTPDAVAEPVKPTSAPGALVQSASNLWDRMKKQGSLAMSMRTSRKLARLQELHPIFLSLPVHTVPGVVRSPPRELVAHDDPRFFSVWQPWIIVNPDALRAARTAIPRLPGLYEWGVLLPGCALPSNPVAMYLGKAGRLVNTNETLRTRFNKYIPGTGNWLGPKQEKDKFALWKEMQRRGFTLVYRWLACTGVEPKVVETKLLELLDWAYNYQENVSRRLLMLPDGRLLADYPVIKFE